ncbi:MAG: hypothetical protein LBP76_07830, partial [Treponema sp.]|nr:hypothetical protein [Treponema sp.]
PHLVVLACFSQMRSVYYNELMVSFHHTLWIFIQCQPVKDSCSAKKGVGVAENPRSGVGARGSSVKKGRTYGKICYTLPSMALPLLNFLTLFIQVNIQCFWRFKV